MEECKIGKKIKRNRLKKGLTQEALGKLAGVTKATVSKWESGKMAPSAPKYLQLCRYLGVKP